MNVLQLSRVAPYPPQNGAEVRVWKTAQQLTEYGTVRLASPPADEALPAPIRHVELTSPLFTNRALLFHLWNGLFALTERHPLRTALSRAVESALNTDSVTFDVVVSEFAQLNDAAVRLADRHDAELLLNKHNAEYALLDRILREGSAPDVFRRRVVRNLRAQEEWALRRADAAVFQSTDDVEQFEATAETEVFVIPNGSDLEWIREGGAPARLARRWDVDADSTTCVFLGSYDYAPNARAATLIDETIAPDLPDVSFVLVGRDPPETTASNVIAPGYVDDLPGALGLADIALCPLRSGSGTKLKLLDYFAAELPVVTTPVGVQGLSVRDGEEVVVVEETTEMIEAIRRLSESPHRRRELAAAAGRVAADHSWASLMAQYDAVFDYLVGATPTG
jgi:glycosyltransferase involved in cell wall biosynthesis